MKVFQRFYQLRAFHYLAVVVTRAPLSRRVLCAPSRPGYMHLAGLRTAFHNYLIARAHKGACILRIEGTDRTGSSKEQLKTLEAIFTGIASKLKDLKVKC